MLQLNFLRNHFLTVRALQRWSRLCTRVISSPFGGRQRLWYSCRNWVTICQGCYSDENAVYIIEHHHKAFIFILSANSVEQTFCWHKITKLKWRILNHFRSDSTKCVRVVPKHRYMKTPVELVRTDFWVPLYLISLLHAIVLAVISSAASPFPSQLDSLPSSSCKHVTPIFKKNTFSWPHFPH